jgi:hypothetical protein
VFIFFHQNLFRGLADNLSISWLDISFNNLTGFPMEQQGSGILRLPYRKESMGYICSALNSNKSLQYLDLSGNK